MISYTSLLTELQISDTPSHIWNTDESGLQCHFLSDRVLAAKGQPCYEVNPGKKGKTITILATFNAVGTYAPVMFIFKGKRLKPELCIGAPADAVVRVSDNGWITKELFLVFAKCFVEILPKDNARPHVLLLDGHSSHVFNIEFLTLMQEHRVHPFCFPPHTTHWLQPADRTLFRSLKHHWTEEGRTYLRTNAGVRAVCFT